MAGLGVTVADLRMALQSANLGLPVGELLGGNRSVAIESGPSLQGAQDVADLVVGVRSGKPVFLREVAQVRDGAPPASRYVWHGTAGEKAAEYPAVTIAITKKPGENAIDVANAVMARVETPEEHRDSRRSTSGRNAQLRLNSQRQGAKADPEAAVCHRFGRGAGVHRPGAARGGHRRHGRGAHPHRHAVCVLGLGLHAQPGVAVCTHFSIGILVDDAIVVVENIHRHQKLSPTRRWRNSFPAQSMRWAAPPSSPPSP